MVGQNVARKEGFVRDVGLDELEAVLAINQANLPEVSSLTSESLAALAAQAVYLRGCELGSGLAGFLLALPPGVDYASENYRWFSKRYAEFLYIDRIAIADFARRRGLGSALYRDIEAFARARSFPVIACEVNLYPPNPGSLTFHEGLGYLPVGSQRTEGGSKEVSMLVKALSAGAASLHPRS